MLCPHCKQTIPMDKTHCPNCGYNLRDLTWVIIKKVVPPDDILIEGLLKSFDIPVQVLRESIGSIYGLAVGPLGEVKIAVPENMAEEALQLLQADFEGQ
ncbi:MAG: hypothetical protein U9N81_06800 [Bacillota bacterium]|nr:hypothetical protein [Bacillota bacterium]